MSSETPPPKGRLISHFEDRNPAGYSAAWSDLWETNESHLWDRGIPSPALIDLLEEYSEARLRPVQGGDGNGEGGLKRKRVLVPGCGLGRDVLSLALHGFDAYGLEISPTGVSHAREYAEKELSSTPNAHYFGEKYTQTEKIERGTAQFLQGDFFDSEADWVKTVGGGVFDVVYDYTFLCALHPGLRPQWAKRMAELLRPGGLLICLEFPMYKDPALPGPPWGLNGVHWEILAGGDSGKGEFTREVYYQPERTFEVGKGTDMISVYRRKGV
ncbi:S-adenosyl-L-methionine-dependent methyltransferase [Aspergillus crustosus]